MLRRTAFFVMLVTTLVAAPRLEAQPAEQPAAPRSFRVLVFSKTAGFRHGSIPTGIEAVRELGKEYAFDVDATEDAGRFTDEVLAGYVAVVFLNTTGDVLDEKQQAAFERYIRGGGGYVGVHSAADTEYDWPWYGRLVGAYFKGHPAIQDATVVVTDRGHPSTRHLPEKWPRRDEWYTYRASPRGAVHVLAELDETTYQGGGMAGDHPIAWCHAFDGGRAFYTGGGHTNESYAEPLFRDHLLGGIRWAAGVEPDGGHTHAPPEIGFVPLFDGRTLDGWRRVGGGATYRVEDGSIVGRVGPGPNTFLRTERAFADFVLKMDVKLDVPGNSGIQFRSHQRDGDGVVFGYQCEIDPSDRSWSGGVYDESRRGWLESLEGREAARAAFRREGWNAYEIRAVGDHIQTWVNGVPCADFHDDADAEGFVALQVHSGKQGQIRWRNIRIRELN